METQTITGKTNGNGGNFHSSGLRQKIDQLMDILWAGGLNNPMDAIEQLSYMLFLRLLWEKDEVLATLDKRYKRIFSGGWAKYGWGNFVSLTGDELFDSLRAALEKLSELPGLSETGKLLFNRATLKIYDRPTLRAAVQGIANLDLSAHDGADVKGDMYEHLLSKLAMSGTNGQFRTPRHIISMIVDLVGPKPGDRICDPACGTAGFLIAAFNYILRTNTSKASLKRGELTGDLLKPQQWKFLEEQAFTGYDNDANMVKITILNLYLHQLEKADIEFHNPLTTSKGTPYPGLTFDVILANPPFAGKVQQESILSDLNHKLNTRATELLFLKWFIDHLSQDGKAGIIVPEGVVLGTDGASTKLRRLLVSSNRLDAVISLPHSSFKPYASVATFILVFRAGGSTARTWMYQVSQDGYSQDSTRQPIEDNDIPDLLAQWQSRERADYRPCTDKHGWVDVSKIAQNDYALAPRLYLRTRKIKHAFPMRSIQDLCSITKGTASAQDAKPGPFPLVTTAEELKTATSHEFEGPAICVPLVSSTGHGHASIKRLTYMTGKFAAATIVAVLQVRDRKEVLPQFVYYVLESQKEELLVALMKGAANVSLSVSKIGGVQIPVPPLHEQRAMIADLESVESKLNKTKSLLKELAENKATALEEFKARLR